MTRNVPRGPTNGQCVVKFLYGLRLRIICGTLVYLSTNSGYTLLYIILYLVLTQSAAVSTTPWSTRLSYTLSTWIADTAGLILFHVLLI